MPSIGLADKLTLDEIKALIGSANPTFANFDSVMNALKQINDKPGGTSFAALIPKTFVGTYNSTAWTSRLDIAGSGYVTGVGLVNHDTGDFKYGSYARITIDGVLLGECAGVIGDGSAMATPMMFRFNTSFKVETCSSTTAQTHRLYVTYLLG